LEELADIETIRSRLAYTYGPGPFDDLVDPVLGRSDVPQTNTPALVAVAHFSDISRAEHSGSFVLRTAVARADGNEVEIRRKAVLTRASMLPAV